MLSLALVPNKKQMIGGLALGALLVLFISSIQIASAWSGRAQDTAEQLRRIVEQSLPDIERGVGTQDQNLARRSLFFLASHPDVAFVEVRIKDHPGIFVSVGHDNVSSNPVGIWPLKNHLAKDTAPLGEVRVYEHPIYLRSGLIYESAIILGVNIALLGALLFGLWMLFCRVEHVLKSAQDESMAKELQFVQKIAAAEVTTSVLHDVANMISSLSATVLRGQGDSKGTCKDQRLKNILASVDQTTKTVSGMIHSQHLLAMGRDDQWDSVTIGRLIEDALAIERHALDSQNIHVRIQGDTELNLVTRRHVFVAVLVNVIKNARESIAQAHGASGTLAISIETDGAMLRLQFSDSGTGACNDVLKRVFERGFSTKRGGHGVGLSGCRYNMGHLAGKITLTSRGVGFGATVIIEHPFNAREALAAPSREKKPLLEGHFVSEQSESDGAPNDRLT